MTVPNLNPYRTYQIVAPKPTHFRPATCEEVDCANWRSGWVTMLPEGDARADYIRHASGRHFTEGREAGMVTFTFPAGQKCFGAADHRVPLERDPLFNVRENGLTRRHTRPELWTEDFSEHLDRVRKIREG